MTKLIPSLRHFGNDQIAVLTLDGLESLADQFLSLAPSLEPFPAPSNNYPGKRRVLDERDEEALGNVGALLAHAKPYLAAAFDLAGFDMTEASYSMVTTPPSQLAPMQRTPHFDTLDGSFFAVLLYLTPCEGTGFYRHRKTGIEMLSKSNINHYAEAVTQEVQPPGYICGSNRDYELIGSVDGVKGRVVAYPGASLHAGQFPPEMVLHDDLARGRLTVNIFLRGW